MFKNLKNIIKTFKENGLNKPVKLIITIIIMKTESTAGLLKNNSTPEIKIHLFYTR